MSSIQVRLARADDKLTMIDFLRDYWRQDHIFVLAPDVFDWQYKNKDGSYNIAIAVQEDDDEAIILGFLGYVPTAHFDADIATNEIMLAIWKIRVDISPPGVGLRLLKLIESIYKPTIIGAIGISDMVEPIYRAFRYKLGTLEQLAIFNPNFFGRCAISQGVPEDAFEYIPKDPIPSVSKKLSKKFITDNAASFNPLFAADGLAKTPNYLCERFLNHPWYDYTLTAISRLDEIMGIIVWRRVSANGVDIIRIVDVVGPTDTVINAAQALQELTVEENAEYIDIMLSDVDIDKFKSAGFVNSNQHPQMVLPNFFSPFEAKNIRIKYAYKRSSGSDQPLRLCRADSDQDRPNLPWELLRFSEYT